MKRFIGKAVALAAISSGLLVLPSTPASAAGCVSLSRVYTEGASRYAVVYNACGHAVSARPTVPNFPDPNCQTIPASSSKTFRTGGSVSPYATGAAEC
ncbi:hypothetical protein GCM10022252_72970 [Streptosporangium oxazolinicum]|uniref:Alpha-amylase n=1 Tax=Streptosporangium oxazolinicum TaxID=909287 RepID=A0ABP8BJB8_9ACTN